MLIIIVFCVFLNFIEFYILNPVWITRRTAGGLIISQLAVLLSMPLKKPFLAEVSAENKRGQA